MLVALPRVSLLAFKFLLVRSLFDSSGPLQFAHSLQLPVQADSSDLQLPMHLKGGRLHARSAAWSSSTKGSSPARRTVIHPAPAPAPATQAVTLSHQLASRSPAKLQQVAMYGTGHRRARTAWPVSWRCGRMWMRRRQTGSRCCSPSLTTKKAVPSQLQCCALSASSTQNSLLSHVC